MGPLGVVEVDPLADDPFGREAVGQLVQVDRLVFQRPPQPLDEDVVHAAAATVHGDAHAGVFEDAGEVEAGELAALVRVGDFWVSVVGQRRIQSVNTEPGVHGVRQPPRQDMARRPVHDGDQGQEATLNRDVGDIGAPDLIGSIDLNPLEQIRVNPMRRVRRAGSRRLIDGFQAHEDASGAAHDDGRRKRRPAATGGPSGGCHRTDTSGTTHQCGASGPSSPGSPPWARSRKTTG